MGVLALPDVERESVEDGVLMPEDMMHTRNTYVKEVCSFLHYCNFAGTDLLGMSILCSRWYERVLTDQEDGKGL